MDASWPKPPRESAALLVFVFAAIIVGAFAYAGWNLKSIQQESLHAAAGAAGSSGCAPTPELQKKIDALCNTYKNTFSKTKRGEDFSPPGSFPVTNGEPQPHLCVGINYTGEKTGPQAEKDKKDQAKYNCVGLSSKLSKDGKSDTVSGLAPKKGCCRVTFTENGKEKTVEMGPDFSKPPPSKEGPPPSTKDGGGQKDGGGGNPSGQDKGGGDKGGGGGGGGMPQLPQLPKDDSQGSGSTPQPPPPPPWCTISAYPSSIQASSSSTLSWSSGNGTSASITSIGNVALSGSRIVSPAANTTYTLTVHGASSPPRTFSDPYTWLTGTVVDYFSKNDVPSATCATSVTVVPSPQPPPAPPITATSSEGRPCVPPEKPSDELCGEAQWEPQYSASGCLVGWRCHVSGQSSTSTVAASISCRPSPADIGSDITIEFACENASESIGNGFSTDGSLRGITKVPAQQPPFGDKDRLAFVLTCKAGGGVHAASCALALNRAYLILQAHPASIAPGERSAIGWITAGMRSCTISSPELEDFTRENAAFDYVNGALMTPPLSSSTTFTLACTTLGGNTRSSSVRIEVE